jgi:biotin carboxyl carrier protein
VRGRTRGNLQEATVEGWVLATALRDDARGNSTTVVPADGTPLRAAAGSGANFGTARFGMRFVRLETKSGWVHVRRAGWIARSAFTAPAVAAPKPVATSKAAATAAPAQAAPATTAPANTAAPEPATNSATSMLAGGTAISATLAGTAVGTFEVPVKAEVLEHRSGWARVRIDGWVREGALGAAPPPGSITAADIRNQPDRYIGQTVEWTLEVIAVQKADDLRPELPVGQPYVLARGPLPEVGFVYMVIAIDQADTFRGLQPLTKIRVRATVRAGRSKYLPVPVLTFVRRLD